ncbi:MAG TPA: hypothetical protein VFZ66_03460 [Herpetosiphonaceae bacterium]
MSKALAQVHTLYVGALLGEPEFGRRLIREMQRIGQFDFTDDRSIADAELEADGEDTGESFYGSLVIRDLQGDILWSGQATRPHGVAGPMAYERILEQLRAALPPPDEHSRTV